MKLEVIADKIELTAEPDTKVRLVEKDGMLVLRGVAKNFDAVKTLKAARDERDVQLARSLRTR